MSGGTPVLVPGDTPGAMSSSAENPFVGMFEVSKHAVWSVSTAKHGNGVQQLLDGSPETFWQSDGAQPHVIDIQFNRLMRISELALYLDYVLDESYTPRKFSVRCGTSLQDLHEVHVLEIDEPKGWVRVPLKGDDNKDYVCCNCVEIAILENHQNGRDSHVRQVKVFASRVQHFEELYTSVEMSQWATLR
eukprot:RCo036914